MAVSQFHDTGKLIDMVRYFVVAGLIAVPSLLPSIVLVSLCLGSLQILLFRTIVCFALMITVVC